jgi:hypothetical protein
MLHISLQLRHAAFNCRLQRFLSVPQFATGWSDVVCLLTRVDYHLQPPKSHHCLIFQWNASQEWTSGEVCLKNSQGFEMKLTLKIESYNIVGITIPTLVTIKTLIVLIHLDQPFQP